MVRVYLLRHCETIENALHIFQGTMDTMPSQEGKVQMEKVAQRFKDEKIDIIYSSDLTRAVKTAEEVNKYHGVPHIKEKELREINMGVMTGMKLSDVAKQFPVQTKNWNEEPHLFVPENGESMVELNHRIVKAFERIVAENKDKTIVLISHGCAIRNILCHCLGKPIEELKEVFIGDNTAVSLAEIENGKINVPFQCDATHLGITQNKNPFYTIK